MKSRHSRSSSPAFASRSRRRSVDPGGGGKKRATTAATSNNAAERAKNRHPAASAPQWAGRLLAQLGDQALADAQRMKQFLPSSLHALRVRMKKLKAIVRLVNSSVPPPVMESILRLVRRVKDRLAPRRDAEVLQKVAQHFQAEGIVPEHPPIDAAPPVVLPALRRLHRQVTQLDLSKLRFDDINKAHRKDHRRTRKAMKRSKGSGKPGDFHRWRRRLKDLYFQSLALRNPSKSAKGLHRLGKLGRLLGKVQDAAMLEEHLARTGADPALRRRVTRHRKDLQGKALHKRREALRKSLPSSCRRAP